MKRFLLSKKGLVLLATLAVAVAAAVGAYAYFTSGGSGNGSATVGTSTAFVLHGTSGSTLYPGTSSVVTFTVDNPGSGNQYLAKIHLVQVDSCTVAWDYTNPAAPTCNGGAAFAGNLACGGTNSASNDFQMADVTVNHDYAPGSGQAVTPTGTLQMNDLNSSQDACKNANLVLELTST